MVTVIVVYQVSKIFIYLLGLSRRSACVKVGYRGDFQNDATILFRNLWECKKD